MVTFPHVLALKHAICQVGTYVCRHLQAQDPQDLLLA